MLSYIATKESKMHKTFHEKLRMLRKEKKLSQVEVGKILHYGYTAISNYENGRNEPTLTDLCRLADFFDVSTDFLLGRTEDRQSHCRTKENFRLLQGISFLEALDLLVSIREKEKKRLILPRLTKLWRKQKQEGIALGWRENLRKIRVSIFGEPLSKEDKEQIQEILNQLDAYYARQQKLKFTRNFTRMGVRTKNWTSTDSERN